ncbi:MAG: serine hydrolase [Candidatus Saccharimonadales bacterium]
MGKRRAKKLLPRRRGLTAAILAAGLAGVITAATLIYKDMEDQIQPRPSHGNKAVTISDEQARLQRARQTKLAEQINSLIADRPGVSFSVAVFDLQSGDLMRFGATGPTRAASTAKLLCAAMFLRDSETGKAFLNERLGGQTALYQVRQLINKSDQAAWDLLRDRLGRPAIKAYAHGLGLTSYDTDNEVISASDMAQFLKKLYEGELLTKANSQRLLSFMRNTNYEQYIPPAVPNGYAVYHKVGFIENYLNDAAIIVGERRELVLVIYTRTAGKVDYPGRAKDMQTIARALIQTYEEE